MMQYQCRTAIPRSDSCELNPPPSPPHPTPPPTPQKKKKEKEKKKQNKTKQKKQTFEFKRTEIDITQKVNEKQSFYCFFPPMI